MKSLWTAQSGCSLESVEICNIVTDLDFTYIRSAIDKAIHVKSTLILIFHKIETVSGGGQMQYPPDEFKSILEYLHEHHGELCVITMTELLETLP